MGMMDLRERKSLREEDMSENKKCCTDCKTTKTPLWRGGPAGPKSLCNACGIRYRKKRRAMMMPLDDRPAKKRDRSQSSTTTTTNTTTSITSSTTNTANTVVADKGPNGNGLSGSLKIRFMVLGNEVVLQRSSSPIVKKQRCKRRKKLGEEEQAAFCLMALSSGSVFA